MKYQNLFIEIGKKYKYFYVNPIDVDYFNWIDNYQSYMCINDNILHNSIRIFTYDVVEKDFIKICINQNKGFEVPIYKNNWSLPISLKLINKVEDVDRLLKLTAFY